ncbi:hypothetical protein DFJ73DRAFT_855742 [Zopfochytrium polystomum]|nr:hypothetical protein DFJ73DRAFT_855742 [Zopfochytrium polystomum]
MSRWATAASDDPSLLSDLRKAIATTPDLDALLDRLVARVESRSRSRLPQVAGISTSAASDRKPSWPPTGDLRSIIHDIAFVNPRKRLDLAVHSHALVLKPCEGPATSGESLAEPIEVIEIDTITRIACVPTPGKTAVHFTIAIFHVSNGSTAATVFGFDEHGPKGLRVSTVAVGSNVPQDASIGKEQSALEKVLELVHAAVPARLWTSSIVSILKAIGSEHKIWPLERHIGAHLERTEGAFYMLPNGILFGFKKPTLFISWDELAGAELTSVTSRTFDIILHTTRSPVPNEALKPSAKASAASKQKATEPLSFEFRMIDGAHLQGVVRYLKHFGVTVGGGVSSDGVAVRAKGREVVQAASGVLDANGGGVVASEGGGASNANYENEDQDYQASESGDEVAEEYDSDAASSSDSDEDSGGKSDTRTPSPPPKKRARKVPRQKQVSKRRKVFTGKDTATCEV